MHSHKLHRDGAPIDDGIHAIPHGLDAIIAISSIRLALLPFQSLFTHKRFTRVQRQQRPYNLQLQSPLNSQGAQVGNREFTLDGLLMRSLRLISDAMPSLLHFHTLFFIHNNIPFTDSQNRVTVTISTPLHSNPLSTTSMRIIIYTLINTTHIHISILHRQHAASSLHLSIHIAIYSL